MTYTYICARNFLLLLYPSGLCHDWSYGTLPVITSVVDPRNLVSLGWLTLVTCLAATYLTTKVRFTAEL